MKKKSLLIISVIIAIAAALAVFLLNQNDCSTVEKRMARIERDVKTDGEIRYVRELMFNYYWITAYVVEDTEEYGVALFEPIPDGDYTYKLISTYTTSENTLHENVVIGDAKFDIFWTPRYDLDFFNINYYDADDLLIESDEEELEGNEILSIRTPLEAAKLEYYYIDENGEEFK